MRGEINLDASLLLSQHRRTIIRACDTAPALDLACGSGRNGLYLTAAGVPVVFADCDSQCLNVIEQQLAASKRQRDLARLWQVDLESPGTHPLAGEAFGAILVFRYLHRPLLPDIKEAVLPGGLVIYETFTVEQATLGRPTNPDFLLHPGELNDCFGQWNILHSFEGIERDPATGQTRAIAQLVAQKPIA